MAATGEEGTQRGLRLASVLVVAMMLSFLSSRESITILRRYAALPAKPAYEARPHPALRSRVVIALDAPGTLEAADLRTYKDLEGLSELRGHMLTGDEMARALLVPGGTLMACSFARFFTALEAGSSPALVALGGSVTTGLTYGQSNGSWTYHAKVQTWLGEVWPHAHIRFSNLGISAAGPSLLEPCAAPRLPEGPVLVLLESAADFWSGFGARDDEPAAQAYERLLRQLTGANAAVVEVASPTFWVDAPVGSPKSVTSKSWPRDAMKLDGRLHLTDVESRFSDHVADIWIHRVCCHYGIPHALQRAAYTPGLGAGVERVAQTVARACGDDVVPNGVHAAKAAQRGDALWPPLPTTPEGTAALLALMRDKVHPAALGHSHMAQLMIAAIQAQFERWVAAGRPACPEAPNVSLPAPMWPHNLATHATCARGEALRDLVVRSDTRGFAYEVEGAEVNPKPGLIARTAGSVLSLRLDAPVRGRGEGPPPHVFYAQVGLLASWAGGMGRANITCAGACRCPFCLTPRGSCLFDGHRPSGPRVSLSDQFMVAVRPARGDRHCRLQVDVLERTSSTGHKVKVTSLLTQLSMAGMWRETDPFEGAPPATGAGTPRRTGLRVG